MREIRSFIRRSRPISQNGQRLLDEILPFYAWNNEIPDSFEIGFGSGDHLYERAMSNPDKLYLGCEPHTDGVINLLKKLENNQIPNIKIVMDDAMPVLKSLPDECLKELFILFPDPWHKKKHNKRRLVNDLSMKFFATKTTHLLFIATDCVLYQDWILGIKDHNFYISNDIFERPKDMPYTKYEKKALGKKIAYFSFIKSI